MNPSKINKIELIGIAFGIAMVGVGIGLVIYLNDSIAQDKADHYQTAIRNIYNEPGDCNSWLSYLKDHYVKGISTDTDYLNYLAHVYDFVKGKGCSPMPDPIADIQGAYK